MRIHFCRNLRTFLGKIVCAETLLVYKNGLFLCRDQDEQDYQRNEIIRMTEKVKSIQVRSGPIRSNQVRSSQVGKKKKKTF